MPSCHCRPSTFRSFDSARYKTSGSQRREEDDFLDRVDPGQQHGHTVHADAQPAGRRHAVLECPDVVLVDGAGLVVAGVLGGLLLLEPQALLDRIVELRVAVAEFARVDEDLEPLGEPRVVTIGAGERRDLLRMSGHERRAHDVGLAQRLEQLLDELAATPTGLPPHAVLHRRAPAARSIGWLGCTGAPGLRRHRVDHPDAGPRLGEIDLLAADLDDRRADRIAGGLGDEHLADVHHVVPVAERLVELHHRELGVVTGGDALVAEDPTDLVHPLHAADDQPLEVQLERDAQVELHVERVVVGGERAERGHRRPRRAAPASRPR